MPACRGGSQKLPPFGAKPNIVKALRDIAQAVNQIIDGRTSNTCEFELTASTVVTTVVRPNRIAENSSVHIQATNANAASEIASIYISDVRNGEFDVTHPSNTSTRTFSVSWIG
jgi:hypothetical protein